ncbi:RDD family protein [Thalassotalea litorea]|uniref:RDD family protein n=1 Tax=Thalassotalea litorea TaxID=2020715 RepID=A0A5R9IKN4_9GAMM|nr:RDD family protein [Thalassotalea litorea]TLU61857.1 RDD family protein [Thalassotalea litorea]
MEKNHFEAPQAELTTETNQQYQLASRWRRFFAAMVDSMVMMLILVPIMYFAGFFDDVMNGVEPGILFNLLFGLIGVAVFVVINGQFLISTGQTVGKKLLSIKIVTEDDKQADFGVLVARYAFYLGIPLIPIIGGFINFVNILFIFSGSKQCLHDRVAATYVVNCNGG